MKLFARIILLLTVFHCVAILSCRQAPPKLTIYGLKGSSGIALLKTFETPPVYPPYIINAQVLPQADIMAAMLISGEAKIGVLPPNVAAKIAASTNNIQIAAVIGTGMLSLLTIDPEVERIEDLIGKIIEVAGQGATPDFVFRKILMSRGLLADRNIFLGYALPYPEIALALAAGRIDNALLPEPFTSMALSENNKIVVIDNIQDEWVRVTRKQDSDTPDPFPMTVLVLNKAFANENRELVAVVLENVKNSIEWVTSNTAYASILAEKHGMGIPAHIVQTAIPKSNYVFIPLPEARAGLEVLYRVFLEFSPASIGGAMPPDTFYFKSQ